jgi:hypothetical protein
MAYDLLGLSFLPREIDNIAIRTATVKVWVATKLNQSMRVLPGRSLDHAL